MKLYDLPNWSSFDAVNPATNQISQREGSRSAAGTIYTGVVDNGFFGAGKKEYSVVGLNVAAIDGMREAIRNYVNEIKNHLDGIDPLANSSNAFRSDEVEQAIRVYISKVKDYCLNLTSQLLAFSDKLADVKSAYFGSMSSIASNINQQTTSFSEGTAYTESMQ